MKKTDIRALEIGIENGKVTLGISMCTCDSKLAFEPWQAVRVAEYILQHAFKATEPKNSSQSEDK